MTSYITLIFFIAFTLILSGGVLPLNLYASGAKDSDVALSFIPIIQAIKITKIGNGGVLCMRCAKKSGVMKKWDNNSAPGPSQEYVKTHDIEILNTNTYIYMSLYTII